MTKIVTASFVHYILRCLLSTDVVDHVDQSRDILQSGDHVLLTIDRDSAIVMQENNGGWIEEMTMVNRLILCSCKTLFH